MAVRDDKLLTVAEVAGHAAVSEKTVRRAIRHGELVASKIGNRLRIAPQAFEDWIASMRVVVELPARASVAPAAAPETGSLARLRAIDDEAA